MCLIAFSVDLLKSYPFLLVANRDEFYNRHSLPVAHWPEHKGVLAGRDLMAGGTWLGINTHNLKLVALTNHRNPAKFDSGKKSRGNITLDFLTANISAFDYIQKLRLERNNYNGYNLILHDPSGTWFYASHTDEFSRLEKGIYGLSNASLNTPWPKVLSLTNSFRNWVTEGADNFQAFDFLQNSKKASVSKLPSTGIPLEREKDLSSIFIETTDYGTVCSSIIKISDAGYVEFTEKTYAVGQRLSDIVQYRLKWPFII